MDIGIVGSNPQILIQRPRSTAGHKARSTMRCVNYCEVIGKLIDAGVAENISQESIHLLGIGVLDFGADLA